MRFFLDNHISFPLFHPSILQWPDRFTWVMMIQWILSIPVAFLSLNDLQVQHSSEYTEIPIQSLSSPNYCNVRFGNILAYTPPIQPAPNLVLPRVYESPLRAQLPNPNPQLSESQSASALLPASVSPAGPSTSVDLVCTQSFPAALALQSTPTSLVPASVQDASVGLPAAKPAPPFSFDTSPSVPLLQQHRQPLPLVTAAPSLQQQQPTSHVAPSLTQWTHPVVTRLDGIFNSKFALVALFGILFLMLFYHLLILVNLLVSLRMLSIRNGAMPCHAWGN